MSPFMRTIVRLRLTGFGYKRIARELQITRDKARYWAVSLGLGDVRGEVPPGRERPAASSARSCARCGAAIMIRHRGRSATFCSRRCRDAADYTARKTRSQQARGAATAIESARGVVRGA